MIINDFNWLEHNHSPFIDFRSTSNARIVAHSACSHIIVTTGNFTHRARIAAASASDTASVAATTNAAAAPGAAKASAAAAAGPSLAPHRGRSLHDGAGQHGIADDRTHVAAAAAAAAAAG